MRPAPQPRRGDGPWGPRDDRYGGDQYRVRRPPRRDVDRIDWDEPDRRPAPPRLRHPLWAKLSVGLGALVMVVSGLSVIVPKLAISYFTKEIDRVDVIPEGLKGTDISGAINFLLIGIDQRNSGPNGNDLLRADSIIVVHIPADHSRVFLISLPRDARVKIPPVPEQNFPGETTKINAAFAYGARLPNGQRDISATGRGNGAVLTMRTISDLVPGGLKFNGFGIIDFDGFTSVVNALGGVHMCIDTETWSIKYTQEGHWLGYDMDDHVAGPPGRRGWHYEVGCRHMEPWEALDYARQRHLLPDGDYDRQRHQQQLIKAIVKQVASTDNLTNFKKISELQQAAGELLTLDLGGNSMEDWVFTLSSLRPDDMVMIKTNGGRFSPVGDDTSDERLLPESLELLKSLQTDTVLDFLVAHQDWVAADA